MIVLRNFSKTEEFLPEERYYTSLKRKIAYKIGKGRMRLAHKLEKRGLREFQTAGGYQGVATSPVVSTKNRKADVFLNKEAAKRNIIVAKDEVLGVGKRASYGGIPSSGDVSKLVQENGRKEIAKGNIKRGRKIERIGKLLDENSDPKFLVHVAEGSGPGAKSHEIGHSIPTRKMKRKTKDPAEQRRLLAEYQRGLKGARDAVNFAAGPQKKVGETVKGAIAINKEEKRATKEGLKLLKEAKSLPKTEMATEKAVLKSGLKSHQHNNRAAILQSLGQKIRIPSRRVVGGPYKSTATPAIHRRHLINDLIGWGRMF